MQVLSRVKHRYSNVVPILSGAQAKRRVLLVEDDPTMHSRLSALAQAEQCEIVLATDGLHAYRSLKSDGAFQTVVINPALRGIDTHDLLAYMKTEKRFQRIPIVLVVDRDRVDLVARGFACGVAACMWKPVAPEALWRTLRLLLPLTVAPDQAA